MLIRREEFPLDVRVVEHTMNMTNKKIMKRENFVVKIELSNNQLMTENGGDQIEIIVSRMLNNRIRQSNDSTIDAVNEARPEKKQNHKNRKIKWERLQSHKESVGRDQYVPALIEYKATVI